MANRLPTSSPPLAALGALGVLAVPVPVSAQKVCRRLAHAADLPEVFEVVLVQLAGELEHAARAALLVDALALPGA